MRFLFQEDFPERIDRFLAKNFSGFSREFCKKLIEKKLVFVNQKTVEPSYKLHKGDIIEIEENFERPVCTLEPEKGNIEILYQDKHIIVVNKPAGIITHPLPGKTKGSLLNLILAHTSLSSTGLPFRPGVVHRLDKDTSGCIVFAITDFAYLDLVNQFKKRLVKKIYRVVVEGMFPEEIQEISLPLSSPKSQGKKVSIRFSGKNSITRFRIIKRTKQFSYIEAMPVTGRTHQIRVSLAFLGHPVVGDIQYGSESPLIKRQALHAYSISFFHPETKKPISFTAKIPEDFLLLLKNLGLIDQNGLSLYNDENSFRDKNV